MKALVKREEKRGIAVATVPKPFPGPRDALIRIETTGICGTDLHIYLWDQWAAKRISVPVAIGHEFVGIIEELGNDVSHVTVGERVSGEGHITCVHCYYCRTGQGHICSKVEIIGVDRDGCFADYLVMPAENLWPVPPGIPNRYAAVFDPLGNAMHTVMSTEVAEKSVLITGAGSIGLFTVGIAKASGASKIIVIEPNPLKRGTAIRVGADCALDPEDTTGSQHIREITDGLGPDIFFEMSGNPKALITGLGLLRSGGTAAFLGIYAADVSINWSELVVLKGITIHGISGRRMYKTWYQSQSFLLTHGALIDPIITHELPALEAEQGFHLMEAGEGIKILLQWIG